MTSSDLAGYYAARVPEYDQVYAKPERQADLAQLRELLRSRLAGRRVLELACGTGYWTAVYAPVAAAVVATDHNAAVLDVARSRVDGAPNATFMVGDAFAPDAIPGAFDACFAGFWWSHVSRSELAPFLAALHSRLEPDARVVFMDNRFVAGSSTPLARRDTEGNSYQHRVLADGRTFEVLKNFPSTEEVVSAIERVGGRRVELCELPYYWCATYDVGPV